MAKISLTLVVCSALISMGLSACSGSSNSETSSTTFSDNSAKIKLGAERMKELEASGIEKMKFALLSRLEFASAEAEPFVFLEGTDMETKMVRRSFFFLDQKQISRADAEKVLSYCAVTVETHEQTKPEDIFFEPGKLLAGQWGTFKSNETVAFNLQLQGGVFRSFFLYCRNVTSAEVVQQHVGHLISMTAQ